MTTCEQCGADAVDARGQCANCGWQATPAGYAADSSPSLGETRAADALDPVEARGNYASPASEPRFAPTAQLPNYAAPRPRPTPTRGAPHTPPVNGATGMTGTARYCGTCGARIAGDEAFCGQCGTPIGASGAGLGGAMDQQPTRYQVGAGWQSGGGNDPTELYVAPPFNPYQHRSGIPYQPAGYDPTAQHPASSSRTARIVFGILCLAGSLGSAVAAIVLALRTP